MEQRVIRLGNWELPEDPYDRIIEMLERIQERPLAFIGGVDHVDVLEGLLWGVNRTCALLGLDCSYSVSNRVIRQRNWEVRANGLLPQMREAGMDDAAIVQELLALEIDIWRQAKQEARNAEAAE